MSYQSPFHMRMRDITNQKDIVMKQTTHQTTPNMMDAYKKVQQSKHEPTLGEVNYRQFTTSSYIKH